MVTITNKELKTNETDINTIIGNKLRSSMNSLIALYKDAIRLDKEPEEVSNVLDQLYWMEDMILKSGYKINYSFTKKSEVDSRKRILRVKSLEYFGKDFDFGYGYRYFTKIEHSDNYNNKYWISVSPRYLKEVFGIEIKDEANFFYAHARITFYSYKLNKMNIFLEIGMKPTSSYDKLSYLSATNVDDKYGYHEIVRDIRDSKVDDIYNINILDDDDINITFNNIKKKYPSKFFGIKPEI